MLAFSLFRAFPNYNFLRDGENSKTWKSAATKSANPAAEMARLFPPASHEAKLNFRLTVPVLARALHLERNGLLLLFALCGVLTLFFTLELAYGITQSRLAAGATCLGVACIWPGILAFHQLLGGFYDAVAICLMLAAMLVPAPLAGIALFAAAWTDERALIAAPLMLVYAALRAERARAIALVLAGGAYVATRLYVAGAWNLLTTGDGVGLPVFLKNFNLAPLGIWTGLGGCWIIVACGFCVLFAKRRYFTALAFLAGLCAVAGVALLVDDVTRSMSYMLPAIFVALTALAEFEPPASLESLTGISALVCVLVPTYFTQSGSATWMLPSVFQALRAALYPRLG